MYKLEGITEFPKLLFNVKSHSMANILRNRSIRPLRTYHRNNMRNVILPNNEDHNIIGGGEECLLKDSFLFGLSL